MPSNEDAFIDLRRLETQTLNEPKERLSEYEAGTRFSWTARAIGATRAALPTARCRDLF
jgi:hypothetical protein